MASTKDLKKRITSVKNTQQITKAMKMVSAAKLRRAQDAITAHRPYAKRIGKLIQLVTHMEDAHDVSPLIKREEWEHEFHGKKKCILVLVTSDRGLCGPFNGNIVKTAAAWIEENQSKYHSIDLVTVGKKAKDYFERREKSILYKRDFGLKAEFDSAHEVSEWLIEKYLGGEVDEVKFVYNEFKNAMSQDVVVESFLPLADAKFEDLNAKDAEVEINPDIYMIKPNGKELLEMLLEKHFSTQVYRVLLESQAGEHGSRMSAMENATNNAKDMMRSLTLQYNKQRQAGITTELLEITAGSEALKG